MQSKRAAMIAIISLTLILASCSYRKPLWEDQPRLTDDVVASLLGPSPTSVFDRDLLAGEVPVVPVRKRLRPCCVFGHGLNAELGPIPIPGIKIQNVIDVDDLGPHRFDAGMLLAGSDDGDFLESEANGLVYTCRGGFIDTAHVRDYADWTMFVGPALARNLETGATIALPPEGGARSIVLAPIPPEVIETYGRRRLAISMAEWVVFQMSIWHEIATWYGWSSFEAFSERASAFSPEDVYSNVVGIKMAGPVIWQGTAFSEDSYNAAVDQWIAQTLRYLGALDRSHAIEAANAVDHLWWDSNARLPDPALVLRRNIQGGSTVWPWPVPTERLDEDLQHAIETDCGGDAKPLPLRVASRVPGLDFERILRFEIELSPQLAAQESLAELGNHVTQADFPRMLESIRIMNREEFGLDADSRGGGERRAPNP